MSTSFQEIHQNELSEADTSKISFLKETIQLPSTNETILIKIRNTLNQYEKRATELERKFIECKAMNLNCGHIYAQLEVKIRLCFIFCTNKLKTLLLFTRDISICLTKN